MAGNKALFLILFNLLLMQSSANPPGKDIQTLSIRLEEINEKIEKIELSNMANQADIGRAEKKTWDNDEQIQLLEKKNVEYEERFSTIENQLLAKIILRLDNIEKKLDDIEEIATRNEAKNTLFQSTTNKNEDKINLRLDHIEGKLDLIQTQATKNEVKLGHLDIIREILDGIEKKSTRIEAKADLFETKTSENEAKTSLRLFNMQEELDLLQNQTTEIEAKANLFESKISGNEARMTLHLDNIQEKLDDIEKLSTRIEVKADLIESTTNKNEAKTILRLDRIQEKLDLVQTLTTKNEEELANQLDDLEVKVEHLTTKTESQELSTSILEKKWAKHEEEIIEVNANCIRRTSGDSQTNKNVPSSCKELAIKGHPFDGLYLVKNSDTKNIEAVLCNFENTDVSQVFIGNVDIKTKSIHFYVQRTSNFGLFGSVIPFEVARLNEGGAFNLASGIFTAPVAGIYNFQLSAVKNPTVAILWIYLQLNGANVGIAGTSQGFTGSFGTVSLSSSLRLKAGDRVNLFHAGGILFDNTERYTHFSGSLVKEDIA